MVSEERRLSRVVTAGEVAAAILTDKGNVYLGVCLDAPARLGCAPCGRCRAFIDAIHDENYRCEVLLEDGSVTTIEQLLPYRM